VDRGLKPQRPAQPAVSWQPPRNWFTQSVEAVLRVVLGRRLMEDAEARSRLRLWCLRIVIAATVVLGVYYMSWRYTSSINWDAWPLGLSLVAAETYSFIGMLLFALTMWMAKPRRQPPALGRQATVDIFITCYNEPVELVRTTVRAAVAIPYPHRTYVLDDGDSPEMAAMAREEGAGYIVRTVDWRGRTRHAKAGNLNNALMQTDGEFILILDADQVPLPQILDRTLGYFTDPRVALVQTPQYFWNTPRSDPFGSQAPLFYGPIQQGKDGWNAAFFCGSNAILRREALMELGVRRYVQELDERVRLALGAAERMLKSARRDARKAEEPLRSDLLSAISALGTIVRDARRAIRRGDSIQDVTWRFQAQCRELSRTLVQADMERIWLELATIPGIDADDLVGSFAAVLDDEPTLLELARRETTPLAAVEAVRSLLLAVDVDRADEAQALMPMSTISVTEDMATAMRLHAAGWRTVYHDEILALGLAPEDLRTALQQRLRWAQGTLQVMLKENPFTVRGLTLAQRLMYFSTMWSYLSGFAAVVYIAAPIIFLFFGLSPVKAWSTEFFMHLVPYLAMNQVMFTIAGWGRSTWRGQQYSLALFPLWIKAVTTTIQNVYFGRKLGFVVTPKTRQGGMHLSLVKPQIVAIVLLVAAAAYGLGRLALGLTDDTGPILVNVFWVLYNLAMLSVVIEAAIYEPEATLPEHPLVTAAEAHGRVAGGGRA
jgi:cellulose synthase (UDP-forming)